VVLRKDPAPPVAQERERHEVRVLLPVLELGPEPQDLPVEGRVHLSPNDHREILSGRRLPLASGLSVALDRGVGRPDDVLEEGDDRAVFLLVEALQRLLGTLASGHQLIVVLPLLKLQLGPVEVQQSATVVVTNLQASRQDFGFVLRARDMVSACDVGVGFGVRCC